jgi:kynurenine 3-monooxygenase
VIRASQLMPRLLDEYARNPVGFLGTVFTRPWVWHDKLALVCVIVVWQKCVRVCVCDRAAQIGDAAHAITPFFGQGCNSGFEDVYVLDGILSRTADMRRAFGEYETARKANADAIANMALDNFTEMMSKTADAKFLLEKAVENALAQRFPDRYVSTAWWCLLCV